MRAAWVVARREATASIRERTILLAVVIQVLVAGFSSLLVTGLAALSDPDSLPAGRSVSVSTNATGPLRDRLLEAGIEVVPHATADEALLAFERGATDAALVLFAPPEPGGVARVTLVLPESEITGTLTLVRVREALEAHERELRIERRDRLEAEPLYVDAPAAGGAYGFVHSLLIPLLVLLPVILAGGLVADSITEELSRGTMDLIRSTPARLSEVLLGKLAAAVVLVPVLTGVWLALLAANGFRAPLLGALEIVVLATALAVLAGVLAHAVALATRDRERAQSAYALLFFLLGGASLLLPVDPLNAVALLAAGSATPAVHAVVGGSVIGAGIALVAGRAMLPLAERRMALGGG